MSPASAFVVTITPIRLRPASRDRWIATRIWGLYRTDPVRRVRLREMELGWPRHLCLLSHKSSAHCEEPLGEMLAAVPPMRRAEHQLFIALFAMTVEALDAGAAEAVDQLHRISEHRQSNGSEPSNEYVLQGGGSWCSSAITTG